jgi:hypothetical protein
MSDVTLQRVVRAGLSSFGAQGGVRSAEWSWCHAVLSCRTPRLGGHKWRCPTCDERVTLWNSCKHRACACCGALDRERWLLRTKEMLSLPCGYHHVTFTVPWELRVLWRHNRTWFANQVLSASRETLIEVLANDRWLGAMPGLLQTWQTWGRSLSTHLHNHILMTAGGWTSSGWRDLKYDYVAPTAVLGAVYRGKLRARIFRGLSSGEMALPADWDAAQLHRVFRKLHRKQWCVRVQPRYDHGEGVMTYLSRYIRGGPLRESQLVDLDSTHVKFSYTDHRRGRDTMRLPIADFLSRLGEHVPEPGFVTVRYGGLFATSHRARLHQARIWLGLRPAPEVSPPLTVQEYLQRIGRDEVLYCDKCQCWYEQAELIEPCDRGPPIEAYRRAA